MRFQELIKKLDWKTIIILLLFFLQDVCFKFYRHAAEQRFEKNIFLWTSIQCGFPLLMGIVYQWKTKILSKVRIKNINWFAFVLLISMMMIGVYPINNLLFMPKILWIIPDYYLVIESVLLPIWFFLAGYLFIKCLMKRKNSEEITIWSENHGMRI